MLSIYPQSYCHECNVPLGFAGQGPAYSSIDGFWLCETHIEQESASWKQKVDDAQKEAKADQRRRARR